MCLTDSGQPMVSGKPVNGWCYVDATTTPPTGNPDIVLQCPATEKHLVRFVGASAPKSDGTLFVACEATGHCAGGVE